MKEFNKERELNKLRLKNNKSKYIKYTSVIVSVVILLVGIIYFTFAKFESNKSYTLIEGKIGDYSTGDIILSYVVDGIKQDVPPGKNDGYLFKSISCTNGDGTWLNDKWGVEVVNLTGKAKCNIEFEEAQYNNVTKWLQTANVNKTYTTLNTLTNNNSSCDYLKNSTEWINDVTTNENAMTYIGNNDYCADILLDDSIWLTPIKDSTYWDKVLQPLIPTMTSNTDPSGNVTCSRYYPITPAYMAFDDNTNTYWSPTNATTAGQDWVQYNFVNNVKVYAVGYSGYTPCSYLSIILYYENSNSIEIVPKGLYSQDLNIKYLDSPIPNSYAIKGIPISNGNYIGVIYEIQLYGRKSN